MGGATQLPWDKIIGAAAASTLGVLSLCVIGIGVLAYLFFGRSDDRVKLWVFGAILLAVIGLAIAVLRESNAAAPPPGPPSEPSPGASAAGTIAATAPAIVPPPPPIAAATGGARGTTPDTAATADAPPDLAGTWRDDDGFVYQVSVDGAHMTYVQVQNGLRVGSGEGTIAGRTLAYSFYVDRTGDAGRCRAVAVPDGMTIDGMCGDGANSWPFRITRDPR